VGKAEGALVGDLLGTVGAFEGDLVGILVEAEDPPPQAQLTKKKTQRKKIRFKRKRRKYNNVNKAYHAWFAVTP
jgi:uncharacterized protein involved in propanediol utilization